MEILIAADIVPTNDNFELFNKADITELIGAELKDIVMESDYRIYNLETPLYDGEAPINKQGPNLKAPTSTVKGIKELKPDLITIANNHIMDHGKQGLDSTIVAFKQNNINYIGAGNNLKEAAKPYILEKDGLKIGVYACAEHEFSIATEKVAGANPFDPLYSLDHITELKKECDYVIVLYHGMKEFYRLPTPRLQKALRRMIDKGADFVICQHNHCVGCEEEYQGKKIIYGQGNFIFDRGNDEYWNTSLLVKLKFDLTGYETSYIPLVKDGSKVRKANEEQAKSILNGYFERSKKAADEDYIEKEYSIQADKELAQKLRVLSGKTGSNIVYKVLNKVFGKKLIYSWYSKKHLTAIRNYIECEVHNEILLKGINNRLQK